MNDAQTKAITVYSSPTCAFCHMAMAYFDSKKLPYKEVDVSLDMKAAQFVQDTLGYIATPVITIDDTTILGFDRPAIDAALQKH